MDEATEATETGSEMVMDERVIELLQNINDKQVDHQILVQKIDVLTNSIQAIEFYFHVCIVVFCSYFILWVIKKIISPLLR